MIFRGKIKTLGPRTTVRRPEAHRLAPVFFEPAEERPRMPNEPIFTPNEPTEQAQDIVAAIMRATAAGAEERRAKERAEKLQLAYSGFKAGLEFVMPHLTAACDQQRSLGRIDGIRETLSAQGGVAQAQAGEAVQDQARGEKPKLSRTAFRVWAAIKDLQYVPTYDEIQNIFYQNNEDIGRGTISRAFKELRGKGVFSSKTPKPKEQKNRKNTRLKRH